jgi:uncharacterized protein YbcI
MGRPVPFPHGLIGARLQVAARGDSRLLSLPVALAQRKPEQGAMMAQTTDRMQLSPSGRISAQSMQLLREYTGRAPTKASTVINDDSVTVLLRDTLTKGERQLVESGMADRVLATRHDFQRVMHDDLVRVVEENTDRKVIAFMSDNHIDPDIGVETFVLEPTEPPVSS